MDKYFEKADSYDRQAEYYECMAECPDSKDCGCDGSSGDDLPPTTILAIFSPFILIAIIIAITQLFKAIKNNRDKKEYEEYQRRLQLGDTKWVKEYEQRREQAFNDYMKKHDKKGKR